MNDTLFKIWVIQLCRNGGVKLLKKVEKATDIVWDWLTNTKVGLVISWLWLLLLIFAGIVGLTTR